MINSYFETIINQLGLGPADFHKKNIMERYIDMFSKKKQDYTNPDEFSKSITMALYTLDGIKDINRIVLQPQPAFEYNNKFYVMQLHQLIWRGTEELFRSMGEKGIMFEKIQDLIKIFNAEDIEKIFILELFPTESISILNYPKNLMEARFLSRYYIEKKDKGLKLLESNGL